MWHCNIVTLLRNMLQNEISLIPVSFNIFTPRRVVREKERRPSTHHNYCHRWSRWDLQETQVLQIIITKFLTRRLERCVLEQPWLPGNTSRRTCKVGCGCGENNKIFPIWRSGIIFSNHYVHASCSPSRAALLTGRFAWKMGMQRGNIEKYQPLGES